MKSTVIFLLFAMFVFPCYSQGWFKPNNAQKLRQGNLDYKKGVYDEAIFKYGEVLQRNPQSPVANFNMGTALYKAGNQDSAMTYFSNAIHGTKDKQLKSKAYYNLGNSYLSKQDYQNAINAYKEALKIDPDNEQARYNLAYALSKIPVRQQQQQTQQQEGQGDDKKEEQQQAQGDKGDKKEEQQRSEQKSKMSKEMAEQILNALNNKEMETRKNLNEKQESSSRKLVKDW